MKSKQDPKPHAGICNNLGCVLSIGWHGAIYFNLKECLKKIPDGRLLCSDCQELYDVKTWGEIKEIVLVPFEKCDDSPLKDRILQCINEVQQEDKKPQLEWRC